MSNMSIGFPNVGLEFEMMGKAVHTAGLDISYFGILVSAGLILAMALVLLEAKRSRENTNYYLCAMLLGLLLGLVGARMYYVGCYYSFYEGNTKSILDIRSGGLALYGAVVGVMLAAALVSVSCRLSYSSMLDKLSLGFLTAVAVGRWGDFFNRASFGEYTDWYPAMRLPLSAVRSSEVTELMRQNIVQIAGEDYIQVHPAFLYESVWCLLWLIILLVKNRKKLYDGQIFLHCFTAYCFGRCFTEWLRTDKMVLPVYQLPINLYVSAGCFLLFLLIALGRGAMTKKRLQYVRQRRELKEEYEEKTRASRPSRNGSGFHDEEPAVQAALDSFDDDELARYMEEYAEDDIPEARRRSSDDKRTERPEDSLFGDAFEEDIFPPTWKSPHHKNEL
ncbi:MAG: prolipoprotein diacylglyceryl transferase [Blautia sp.]|nr:prolipoprotein diacylglyceryl transferase [Blautia sp.]